MGNGQLTELAGSIKLLVVHRDSHTPGLFRYDHQRARRCRVLDLSSGEVRVEGRVYVFGQDKVHAMGSGRDRSTARRDRDLEGHQGAETKVRL